MSLLDKGNTLFHVNRVTVNMQLTKRGTDTEEACSVCGFSLQLVSVVTAQRSH